MEPSLKVLLFAVAYVVVCMGICLLFKVGCYEDEDENPEFLLDVQNHQNDVLPDYLCPCGEGCTCCCPAHLCKCNEEDYFHTEGSTYL